MSNKKFKNIFYLWYFW